MSDTPETDAFMTRIRGIDGDKHWVPADTARRLERERDKARRERDESQLTLTDIHRWIERNHPDGFIDSLTFYQNLERAADRWDEKLEEVERKCKYAKTQQNKNRDQET
jgi:hypothetical protein